MLRELSLGIIVLAISSTNVFALELYKATLISHKESTTGGITARFKSAPNHMRLLDLQADEGGDYTEVHSDVEEQTVKLGEITPIQSALTVFLRNQTDTTQKYVIYTETCVTNSNDNALSNRCATSDDTFDVEPEGYISSDSTPELLIQLNTLTPQTLSSGVGILRLTPSLGTNEYIGYSEAASTISVTAN